MTKVEKVLKPWGYYQVLHDTQQYRVKLLVVCPGHSLSLQKHNYRSEIWFSPTDKIYLDYGKDAESMKYNIVVEPGHTFNIECKYWHRLYNPTNELIRVFEVQLGERCLEEDNN